MSPRFHYNLDTTTSPAAEAEKLMDQRTRQILVIVLIGIAAGWLASIVVGGGGLLRYLLTGLIGAFVGGYLFDLLGIRVPVRNALLSQIITATIGAIVVVLLARLLA